MDPWVAMIVVHYSANEKTDAEVSCIASPNLGPLNSYELSNLIWAYAKVQIVPTEFFQSFSEHLLIRERGSFAPNCFAAISWSCYLKNAALVLYPLYTSLLY